MFLPRHGTYLYFKKIIAFQLSKLTGCPDSNLLSLSISLVASKAKVVNARDDYPHR